MLALFKQPEEGRYVQKNIMQSSPGAKFPEVEEFPNQAETQISWANKTNWFQFTKIH